MYCPSVQNVHPLTISGSHLFNIYQFKCPFFREAFPDPPIIPSPLLNTFKMILFVFLFLIYCFLLFVPHYILVPGAFKYLLNKQIYRFHAIFVLAQVFISSQSIISQYTSTREINFGHNQSFSQYCSGEDQRHHGGDITTIPLDGMRVMITVRASYMPGTVLGALHTVHLVLYLCGRYCLNPLHKWGNGDTGA